MTDSKLNKELSTESSLYIDIYNLVIILITNYQFIYRDEKQLEKWILNLENPNNLDVVDELKQIDIWLGEDEARPKKWGKSWKARVQGWLIRTKRFPEAQNSRLKPKRPIHPKPKPKAPSLTAQERQELKVSTISLLQEFLMKQPALYLKEPKIYSDIPWPKEWDNENHWGWHFRCLRKGYEHLDVGPCPPKKLIPYFKDHPYLDFVTFELENPKKVNHEFEKMDPKEIARQVRRVKYQLKNKRRS
tara:strand:- start:5829 stop:6566 length:738 start_codon:yes stop_codon:yes gene_type:complete